MTQAVEKYDALKLENQLCFPLYAAARLITKSYTPVLNRHGLTYLQYLILMVLWEDDNLNVKQIGKKLYLDSGTLTPVLKKMEKLNIINRHRSDVDDRIVINELSKKGLSLKDSLLGVPFELFDQSGLDIKEAQNMIIDLKSLLGKISHKNN